MESLMKLESLLDKEIDKMTAKGELAPTDVKVLGDVVDIYKDIETICAMKDYGDNDSSYSMSHRGYSSERYPRMYRDEDMHSHRKSYDNYRNTEKDEMIEKLERKLRNAKSEEERRSIMECIDTLEGR